MLKKYFFFFFLISVVACKKKAATPIDLKESYFPLEVNHWIIYDVDSLVYNSFTGTHYTHHLQVKMLMADTFRDNQNDLTYRFERWKRDNTSQSFTLADVWQAKRKQGRVEVVEENQRFIKFTTPVLQSTIWKGNIYTTPDLNNPTSKFIGDWDYTYAKTDEAYSLGGITYDSSATVSEHTEDLPQLESYDFKTVYAKHIGAIYMKRKFLEKQPSDVDWQDGFDVTYTINSYGVN